MDRPPPTSPAMPERNSASDRRRRFDGDEISGRIRRVTWPLDHIGSVCRWDRDHVPGEAKCLRLTTIECSFRSRLWRSQCRDKDGDVPVTTLRSCWLQDSGSRPGDARAERNDERGEQEPASQGGWPDFDDMVRPCSEENHLPALLSAFWMAHLKPIPYSSISHPGTGAFRIRRQAGWTCRHTRQIGGRVRLFHSPCTSSLSGCGGRPWHFVGRPTARSVTLERATSRVEQTAFIANRRGREMIDLLAVEEPKPKRANSYDTTIRRCRTRQRTTSCPNACGRLVRP